MKAPKIKRIPEKVIRPKEEVKRENSYNPQPSLSVSEDHVPQIKTWSVGDSYDLVIKVKMTGARHAEYGDDKGKIIGDFKITHIGVEEPDKK